MRETRIGARPLVIGVDEAGRGPLAGPVVAAAVALGVNVPQRLDDSKKLSARRRAALDEQIRATCGWGLGVIEPQEIDRLNILVATMHAMTRAVAELVKHLGQEPDAILIDGNMIPRDFGWPAEAVIGGDALCLSIAAASILAKVARDRIMVGLAQQHPGYGWERNCGYPTKQHLEALLNLGVTPHHRRSFKPVHNILYQEVSISA